MLGGDATADDLDLTLTSAQCVVHYMLPPGESVT